MQYSLFKQHQSTHKSLKKRLRQGSVKEKTGEYTAQLKNRLKFLVGFFSIAFVFLAGRIVWVGLMPVDEPAYRVTRMAVELPVRGNIYDRNGLLLATTLNVHSLYADPKMMLDAKSAAEKLGSVFPDLNVARLTEKFSQKNRRFVWVKRQLIPSQVRDVNNLGIPGIGFKTEEARLYPHGKLFAHVLGGVSVDGKGLSGVEGSYDEQLSTGKDVHLTVDVRLQQQLRDSLLENIERTEAKASWGVLTEPLSGAILAMVSLPDYDPNRLGEAPKASWMNRNVKGAYEMGSIFKILTMAQGIDEGYVHRLTPLDVTKPIRIGRFTIRDFHPRYEIMPLEKAFRRSSNVGAARVADMFGAEAQQDFFAKLGLLEPIDVGLREVGRPLVPRQWKRIQTMTISFGHGIAVTPVHMAAAVGALVGDGYYRPLTVLKQEKVEKPLRKIVNQASVNEVRYLMQDVVENGTGRRGSVKGISIGGKTGTSEKNKGGHYLKHKNIASFIGVMPVDNPQYLALVMVDEGKKGASTGGTAAAPVFKSFAERVIPMVGLRPKVNPMDAKQFDIVRAHYASF